MVMPATAIWQKKSHDCLSQSLLNLSVSAASNSGEQLTREMWSMMWHTDVCLFYNRMGIAASSDQRPPAMSEP